MKRLTIKQRSFSIIALLVFIIAFIGTLIVVPAVRGILSTQADIITTHEQLDQELQRTRQLRRSLSEFHVIKSGTKRFTGITIKPNQALAVIDEMESLATRFRIDQTSSVEIKDQKKPAEYIFTFVNQGTLESQLAYLKAIESLPYYVFIDALSWAVVQGENPDNLITLRFTATVYEDTFAIEETE